MDRVRVLEQGSPRAGAPRGRYVGVLVAVALVAAVVALAQTPGVSEADSVVVPELTAPPPVAVAVVEEFHAALADGDAARAAELVAPSAGPLALPGMALRYVPADTDEIDLVASLEFYGAALRPTVAGCQVDRAGATVTGVGCVVHVRSPLAAAGGVADAAIPTVYTLVDDRIVAVLPSPAGTPDYEAYCHWVERTMGTAAGQVFDERCRPVATAAAAAAHLRLADEFFAAGSPAVDHDYRLSRLGVGVVATLQTAHNHGHSAAALTIRDEAAVGYPGLVGSGPAPTIGAALGWSGVVYRMDLGVCSVDATGADLRVVCPRAAWSGPLVAGLGLDPIVQSVTVIVDGASVLRFEGGTPAALAAAFEDFCAWVYAARPHTAPAVFDDGCRPTYDAEAGRRLLVVLSGYTDDPR